MARKQSRFVDYLVYLAVRFVACILLMLGYERCMRLSNALAWLVYKVDRRHRLVADENLRLAFPDLDDTQRDAMVRGVYRHFIGLVVSMIYLPRHFHITSWKRYLDIDEPKPLIAALLSGRPLMIVTGHFGNWELGNYVFGLLGFRMASVARRLDNPYLHDYILSFRARWGHELLDKSEDYERMLEVLQQVGILATLGDQDAGQRGLYVDFFGRPASTHKAMALMALQYRTPILVMGGAKTGEPMRHRTLIEDIILPEDYDDHPDAVRVLTQRMTAGIERMARRYPEQYFWLHRRWKHQPAKRKGAKAA